MHLHAQHHDVDTSYTLTSAYQKIISQYPAITLVKPEIDPSVNQLKDIMYKTSLNDTLRLDAYYSKKEIRPAVVLVHGGGWSSGNKSMMKPLATLLASSGYQCFAIQYRLSSQEIYPAAVKDVKSAIRFIRSQKEHFFVDSSKIAILGCSAGGQLAALVGTTNGQMKWEDNDAHDGISSTVQAIIDIDGIVAFDHPESREAKSASIWLGGSKAEVPDTWKEASPLTYVGKNTPPTLFINGKYERFHAGRDDMVSVLESYDIPYQIKTIPNAPHTFWHFNPWFEETSNYTVSFLNTIFN